MNFNVNISTIRGGSLSADFSVGRGGSVPRPKKTFGEKPDEPSDADLLAALDRVHAMMRGAMTPERMSDLLNEYILISAWRARSRSKSRGPAAPFVPGGSVLSAAISAVGASTGGTSPA